MAIILASSCGLLSEDATDEPDLDDVIDRPSERELILPLDSYQLLRSSTLSATMYLADSILMADCLAQRGFERGILPYPDDFNSNARRYGLIDLDQARRYGYRSGPEDPRSQALMDFNAEYTVPEDEHLECTRESSTALGSNEALGTDNRLVDDLTLESWDKSHADSRVQDVIGEWSDCMGQAGYEEAEDPLEFSDRIAAETSGEDEAPPEEVEAAVADVECKQKVNLAGIWLAVETAYQDETIEEHGEQLRAMKERIDRVVEESVKVIEQSGYGELMPSGVG